jgi:hypothetical protein
MWLLNTEQPNCPICRRDVPFQITYDFSHPIIRIMNFLYILEIFLYETTPVLQGTMILAFPFIFPCSKDFMFFATHYSIHSIFDILFISQKQLILFRYLHLIILGTYIHHIKTHPLKQFISGRAIIYSKTLEYSEVTAFTVESTTTQPTTNALEGNKPRRRRRNR